MATEVDNRVVQMTFNNAQFEKGVDKTLKTIDKLNKALKFEDASDGFEDIQNAADSINLHTIADKIDSLTNRFSAFGIMGMQVWSRIGNAAIDFVTGPFKTVINGIESGIDAVTNQVKTGGWNRALNLEQAEFLIEGLGYAWEKGGPAEIIKEDGKEIANIYNIVDEAVTGTAYSLDEAAKVAGSLLTSNVNAEDGTLLGTLRAISGVAAMTSSDFASIGDIFGTIAGQGKLMTMQLRQLESRGLNAAAILADALGTDQAAVREMVTEGEIDFETFSMAMEDAFGDKAQKANETFTGSLSNVKSALSRIGARFAEPLLKNLIEPLNEARLIINQFGKALDNSNITSYVEKAFGAASQKVLNLFTYKVKDGDTEIMKLKASVLNFFYQVEKIGNGLRAGFSAIGKIFKMFKESWNEVFGKKPANAFAKRAESIRDALYSINHRLKYDQPLIDKIKETFKGILIVVRTALKVFKAALKVIGKVISLAAKGLSILLNFIAKGIILIDQFVQWIKQTKAFTTAVDTARKVFDTVTSAIAKVIGKFVDFLKKAKLIQTGVKILKGIFKTFGNAVKAIFDILHGAIEGFYTVIFESDFVRRSLDLIKKAFDSISDSVGGVFNKVKEWAKQKFENVSFTDVRDNIVEFFTGTLPDSIHKFGEDLSWCFANPNEALKLLLEKIDKLKDKVENGLVEAFHNLKGKVHEFGSAIKDARTDVKDFSNDENIDPNKVKEKFSVFTIIAETLEKASTGLGLMKDFFSGIFDAIFGTLKPIYQELKSEMKDFTFDDLLDLIERIVMIFAHVKWAEFAGNLGTFFKTMTTSFQGVLSGTKKLESITTSMIKVAAAIFIMALAFEKLGKFDDKKLTYITWTIVFMVGAIAGIIKLINSKLGDNKDVNKAGVAIESLKHFGSELGKTFIGIVKSLGTTAATAMLIGAAAGAIIGAILSVMLLVKVLDTCKPESITSAIEIMGMIAVILIAIIGVAYLMIKNSEGISGKKMAGVFAGIAVLLVSIGAVMLMMVGALVAIGVIAEALDYADLGDILHKGALGLIQLMVALVVMVAILMLSTKLLGKDGSAAGKFAQLVGIAVVVVAIGFAMLLMVPLIATLAGLESAGLKIADAISAIFKLFIAMALIILVAGVVGTFCQGGGSLLSTVALIAVSAIATIAVLIAFTTAAQACKDVDMSSMFKSLLAIGGLILLLGAITAFLTNGKSIDQVIAMAAVIASFGASILLAAIGLKKLSEVNADDAVDALVPLMIAIVCLALLGSLIGTTKGAATGMAALGFAMLGLGAGLFLTVAALYLLTEVLGIFADHYEEFSKGIEGLTQTIVDILLGFIEKFVEGLKKKINHFVYQIGDLLLALIIGVICWVKDRAFQIGIALGDLLFALVEVLTIAIIRFIDDLIGVITGRDGLDEHSPSKRLLKVGVNAILGFIGGFLGDALETLWKGIKGVISDIVGFFTGLAKDLFDAGKDALSSVWDGFSNAWEWVSGKIKGIADGITGFFKGAQEEVAGIFEDILGDANDHIDEIDAAYNKLNAKSLSEKSDIGRLSPYKDRYDEQLEKLKSANDTLIRLNKKYQENWKAIQYDPTKRKAYIDELNRVKTDIYNATAAIQGIYEAAGYSRDDLWETTDGMKFISWSASAGKTAAEYLVQGFDTQIVRELGVVDKSMDALSDKVKMGFEYGLGINSPSKVFMMYAHYMIEGLNIGLKDEESSTQDILTSFAESIASFDTDIESPTITPVLDLTEIQNGANQISAMMSNQKAQVLASMDIKRSDVRNGERLNDLTEAVNHLTIRTDSMDISGELGVQSGLLGQIIDALANQNVVLDSGALVGGITTKMDKALGARSIAVGRRAY